MNRRDLRLAAELVIAIAIVDEIPVSGEPPPADVPIVDGYHEDYAAQVFANNQAQRDAWAASDTFIATVVAESNERLPIDTPSLSGTATSTSSATGTLSVTALVETEPTEPVLRLVWQKPPPDTLHDPHLASLGNDLPFAPVSLSGSASSTSTATGTLSGSALYPEDIGPDFVLAQRPVDSSALLLLVANAEEIPVDGTVVEVSDEVMEDAPPFPEPAPMGSVPMQPEELPVAPVSLSGTAVSTSTATGTLSVGALVFDDPQPVGAAPGGSVPVPPEELSVNPVSLSGAATSTSSATGSLSESTLLPEDTAPDLILSQRPPDNSALLVALANAEEIPVTGAAPVAGDEVPDEPTPIVTPAPMGSAPVQDAELPIAPVALSGAATSTSTATGTVSAGPALYPEDSPGPEFVLAQRPPDNTPLLLTLANPEEIPVSGLSGPPEIVRFLNLIARWEDIEKRARWEPTLEADARYEPVISVTVKYE